MTDMIGPSWLATVVGIISLATTVGAAVRIVGAWRTGLATDYAVEICHGVMGVSMAGMLIPKLLIVTPGVGAWTWLVVSCLMTAWFAVGLVRDAVASVISQRGRPRRLPPLSHLPHLVLSGTMIYMLTVPIIMDDSGDSPTTGMAGMSMSAGSMSIGGGVTTTPGATLDLLFAVFIFGHTVLLIDRFPVRVQPNPPADGGWPGVQRETDSVQHGADSKKPLFAPRSAALLSIATSLSMAYMLIMMFI